MTASARGGGYPVSGSGGAPNFRTAAVRVVSTCRGHGRADSGQFRGGATHILRGCRGGRASTVAVDGILGTTACATRFARRPGRGGAAPGSCGPPRGIARGPTRLVAALATSGADLGAPTQLAPPSGPPRPGCWPIPEAVEPVHRPALAGPRLRGPCRRETRYRPVRRHGAPADASPIRRGRPTAAPECRGGHGAARAPGRPLRRAPDRSATGLPPRARPTVPTTPRLPTNSNRATVPPTHSHARDTRAA